MPAGRVLVGHGAVAVRVAVPCQLVAVSKAILRQLRLYTSNDVMISLPGRMRLVSKLLRAPLASDAPVRFVVRCAIERNIHSGRGIKN